EALEIGVENDADGDLVHDIANLGRQELRLLWSTGLFDVCHIRLGLLCGAFEGGPPGRSRWYRACWYCGSRHGVFAFIKRDHRYRRRMILFFCAVFATFIWFSG